MLVSLWTLTCINWLRQEPYVLAWSRAYRDDGFVVIGVHREIPTPTVQRTAGPSTLRADGTIACLRRSAPGVLAEHLDGGAGDVGLVEAEKALETP